MKVKNSTAVNVKKNLLVAGTESLIVEAGVSFYLKYRVNSLHAG